MAPRVTAQRNAGGKYVVQARPLVEFDHDATAQAMAITFGAPRPKIGRSNVRQATQRVTELALRGEHPKPDPTAVQAWRERLVDLDVFPHSEHT
jgi:hypothetical protein